MAKHEIYFRLPERQIVNADAEFTIYTDDEKLGTLNISKGSLDWMPSGFSSPPYKISWEKFSEVMKEQGKR